MSNYEKLKTLCHQNYIGSEKCGECEGDKWMYCINELEKGNPAIKKDCTTCKGKGYTIPLEFGCKVLIGENRWRYITEVISSDKVTISGYKQIEWGIGEFENLGKPLTLQMVLRLLQKDRQHNLDKYEFIFSANYLYIKRKDLGIEIKIDLTKEPKDWSEETLQSIIDIVK